MFRYIRFLVRFPFQFTRFRQLTPAKKALYLERQGLFFEAGRRYMRLKAYSRATDCFLQCNAPRHLIRSYLKQNLVSDALDIAQAYKLYSFGAAISMKHNNTAHAAYFYSFSDPAKAIKLYKKEKMFLEAGICYLSIKQYLSAFHCFQSCPHPKDKVKGLMALEEVAITLYLHGDYMTSFRIFVELRDYHSALACAKKLKDPTLLEETTTLLHTYDKNSAVAVS